MSLHSKFTDAEWQTLQFSPLWIFTGVAAIDGSITQGEMEAFAGELSDVILYKNPLVREVLISVAGDMASVLAGFREDSRQVADGLADVAAILEKKTDAQEAKEFKMTLLFLARKIAEVSEGDSSGSGESAGDTEKASVVFLAQALKTQ